MRNKALLLIFVLSFAFATPLPAQISSLAQPDVERRVDSLLKTMSLTDKLTLLGGEDTFYTKAISSIGLGRLKMSDGPVGVRVFGPSTAYPASIALAAAWDPSLAIRVGAALGEDARARGVHVLLGPGVNIYRASPNGRNMEYFGEDPYLAGRLAVAYIQGVQSKGVVATVKHLAANNSEYDRHNADSVIDERTLRELYLPAFEMAVKEGKVGAVMDSYNLLNGEHLTQNRHLNIDILKREWGFDGILMSDWEATYDGVAAANAGLDLEMPGAKFMSVKTLTQAVQENRVSEATIDDKVRRILRIAVRFGFFDHDQRDLSLSTMSARTDKVALDEALESAVLLRNEGHLLPLDPSRQRHIIVVGPNGFPAIVGGGGSSHTTPVAADSILSGITEYLGDRGVVTYIAGTIAPEKLFHETHFSAMTQSIYPGESAAGLPISSSPANQIDAYRAGPHGSVDNAKVEKGAHVFVWSGKYIPATDGQYILAAIANREDSYSISIDGKAVLEEGRQASHPFPAHTDVLLSRNKPVTVEIRYTTGSSVPHISVGLCAADLLLNADDKKLIGAADAVVVALGMNDSYEGEGYDRPFQLPVGQEELLKSVLALNPRTIVDIQAGGAVDAHEWANSTPALIQSWYPGQHGGAALAKILFGDCSPEGKLPMSWERTLAENPSFSHYYEEPGEGHRVHYAEGLSVGYRYYTSEHKEPLFSFGFGLSYTTFELDNLKVLRGSVDDHTAVVSVDVKNTGTRAGAEVVQIYVGDPSAKVQRPLKELKGFAKVRLAPGEMRTVTFDLDRRAFSYYDVNAHDWRIDPGAFEITAGTSSVDDALKARIVWDR